MKVKIIKVTIIDGTLLHHYWKRPMQLIIIAGEDYRNKYFIDELHSNKGTEWRKYVNNGLTEVKFYLSKEYMWIKK